MREAIGGSLLLNLIIVFSGIVILFFVGILAYSKAYRVKNRIIEVIEKYETYNTDAIAEINADLKDVGYRATIGNRCDLGNLNTSSYSYCVYLKDNTEETGTYYYEVVTYVQFDFPVIGNNLTFPVKGETIILGKNYDY